MTKIIIADDHSIIREGLKQIVTGQLDVNVLEAQNGQEVLNKLKSIKVDVVILDISMPGKSGLDVLKEIKTKYPEIPVLMLSVYPEDQYAVRTLKMGAAGYLTKDSAPEELVSAIKKVIKGERYISKYIAEKLNIEAEGSGKIIFLNENLLNDLGIIPAIEWYVHDFHERTNIKCSLNLMPEDISIDDEEIAEVVFKIFQETLTNIIRHAKAKKVSVNINKTSTELILEIKDDGMGITNTEIFSKKSFGLIDMRQRIKSVNGRFSIKGEIGKGTIISVRIPI